MTKYNPSFIQQYCRFANYYYADKRIKVFATTTSTAYYL